MDGKFHKMIDNYEFGKIVVNGKTYENDIIIIKNQVVSNWWRKQSHKLCLDDMKNVWVTKPTQIVVGTGYDGMMRVEDEVVNFCKNNKIKLIVLPTTEAVTVFNNVWHKNGTVALLHLTC